MSFYIYSRYVSDIFKHTRSAIYTIMVNQRISEPSSPNSTNGDGDDDNSNNILHGINNGVVINWNSYPTDANGIEDDNNDDDLTNQTAPIGYVLLGSEVLHAADDGGDDSEADDDDALSVSENEQTGNPTINQNDSSIQSLENDGDSINLDIDVDQLLNRQLARTEFEPRGAFSDSNLFVGTVEDTSHIELWNENTPPSTSQITITPDEADKIKTCMSNFQLPVSRYPPWATQIPEELWKAKLLEKLGSKYKP
uniref:Male-enhanced antigen 1 n=1 Tax=Trichobilharzia regenti TaxID=157069 RepID=A0AA85K817_TRIRE|nr:unnamed protein product [Trichobilharzia regenti]